MPDFSIRSNAPEIMDDLSCSGEVVHQTLRELEFINLSLGGNHVTIDALKQLLRNRLRDQAITIADVGCGSGDILRLIHTWASRRGYKNLKLTGIDANPNIIAFAKQRVGDFPIVFEALDIFSDEFRQRRFDIVIGTLFYHHFTRDQLVEFFAKLRDQVNVGIIINDIHRHPFAYYSIKWLTRAFSKSAMVRYDAPLSVLRSFKKKDLEEILQNAGIERYAIKWKWAFRWQVLVQA